MVSNIYESELFEKALETFIDYLEEKQEDTFWLMVNHQLIEDMFRALNESEDSDCLLPALKVLERDPAFSERLDINLLNLVLQYNCIA
jgi:hypothetical protein